MRIVFFTHPDFSDHQSMPRFARMLADGMKERGYEVEIWSPKAVFFKLPAPGPLKKWLGYIDQFIIFPATIKKRIKTLHDTLYVFTDHALGMWVPITKHLPHVIICHDFLAQRSAKGEIPQNPTSWSGRIYQQLIHKGYTKGENFISVSGKTQQDLHKFLGRIPAISKVVYNGLNRRFVPVDADIARQTLNKEAGLQTTGGYILHVGGNQWYKNRTGVIKIYNAWRAAYNNDLPLLLIGLKASPNLLLEVEKSPYRAKIHLLAEIGDEHINAAYSGATVLLFPSLAEGFGWPIAEAMASGCPVITTAQAPMTEVGGEAAVYIPAQPLGDDKAWAIRAAEVLNQTINLPVADRPSILAKGLDNAKRFNTSNALDQFEKIFNEILT